MKHLSLQWRITLLTALLIACACVCMNLLLYRTGVTGMDALNGFMMQYQPGSADPLTIEIPQEEMSSLLAHFSQEVYDAKVVFGRKGWCITVVVTIVSAAIAYFVSGRALKPLQQLAQQAQQVDQDSIATTRLDENTVQEFGQLSRSVNRMLDGLAQSFELQRQFAGNAAHELRTPLTSIRGWVETLMTLDDPTDENYRKGLEIINNETGRLNNMVEELLDFSRLQNGRIRMECRPLDLVAELTDAVLFCEARIRQEGLLLHYAEPEEMIPVYADPDRLRQVFINILDNAIKYSAPGGRITVKLWAGEYKAFVEIIDQGRGIPPEDLENVKTKFYKGSNSVRGSGIGLALVDSIMTALDGTLDIKSTLGRGTVVTLGLPLYHKA